MVFSVKAISPYGVFEMVKSPIVLNSTMPIEQRLATVLNDAWDMADLLRRHSKLGKITAESHGNVIDTLRASLKLAESYLENIASKMES